MSESEGSYDYSRYLCIKRSVLESMKTSRRTVIRTFLIISLWVLVRRWLKRRRSLRRERAAARLAWSSRPSRRKIDLNRATIAQLSSMPGIGRGLAGRIIAYRRWIRPFQQPEDLLLVPGMSESKLKPLRDILTVTSP